MSLFSHVLSGVEIDLGDTPEPATPVVRERRERRSSAELQQLVEQAQQRFVDAPAEELLGWAAEEFGTEILGLSVALGGTITGEHGVGLEKINQMCAQFTTAEVRQFFRVKAAFDPPGLLNPGKAIPTLNRCAEYGRMKVSKGHVPYPDIPRF